MTATVIGSGTIEDIKYWDLRISGTMTAARDCDIRMNPITAAPAAAGQTWTGSCYLQEVGGSQTNVAFVALQANTYTSGSVYVNSPWADTNEGITTAALSTQRKSRSAVLSGGTVAYICPFLKIRTAAAGAVDLTIRIGEPQIEPAASMTAVQKVATRYDITEAGVPSIPANYFDGGDYLTTGVQEITATADFFADAGHACAAGGAFSTFVAAGNLVSKAGATSTNRTFQLFVDTSGELNSWMRGAFTDSSTVVNNGQFHTWLAILDGPIITLWIDDAEPITLNVGSAAEESQNILVGARTESSPAGFFTGFNNIDLLLSRAPSAAEAAQFMADQNRYYRGV